MLPWDSVSEIKSIKEIHVAHHQIPASEHYNLHTLLSSRHSS